MSFHFKVAGTIEEKELVYKFRYKVYVEELGECENIADHQQQMFYDELDIDAFNFMVFNGADLVGVARGNIVKSIDLFQFEIARLDKFKDYLPNVSYVSRMAVLPEYRLSMLVPKLMTHLFKMAIELKISINIINSPAELVNIYQRFGCVKYHEPVYNCKYSQEKMFYPMCINLLDTNYLKSINSPVLKLLKKQI